MDGFCWDQSWLKYAWNANKLTELVGCVRACVCVCVLCGINPFTGVCPESTGVIVDAGAASRKTFVTFTLRATQRRTGAAPQLGACTKCRLWLLWWILATVYIYIPAATYSNPSIAYCRAMQFICALHLPINSYLSSHAGRFLGDCINQCARGDNSYTIEALPHLFSAHTNRDQAGGTSSCSVQVDCFFQV